MSFNLQSVWNRVRVGRIRILWLVLGAMLLAAALLGGCADLHPTPYNGRESCDGVGGIYTGDGRCLGGNA